MEYLENAFKFWGKYVLLIMPLFIMNSALIFIGAPALQRISSMLNKISESTMASGKATDINVYEVFAQIAPDLKLLAYTGALAILLTIFILPATYGMIIKGYDTGVTSLNSFFISLKKNFIKFMLWLLGVIFSFIVVIIVLFLVIVLFTFMYSFSWQLSLIFFAGIVIATIIIVCLLFNIFNICFIAMSWDDMTVIKAISKSFKLVKSYFWSSIGITFSMGFLYITANALIGGVLDTIFIVGPVVKGFLISICIYVLMIFGFEIYRDRTNKKTKLGDYL